ncbi:MAG: hypothetical protein ACRD2T_10995 [Thermoanaerobaculia bacterium]
MSQPVKSQIKASGEGLIGRSTTKVKDHWVFFWLFVIAAVVTIGVAIDQCSREKEAPAAQTAEPRSVDVRGDNDEARAAALGGDFSPVAFVDFLDALENESLTSLQRDGFIEGHLNKRIVWEGLVSSVEGRSDSIMVVLRREDDTFGIALLNFSMDQRSNLLELHPMQKIKVTCVIDGVMTLDTPSLRECSLLRVWKQASQTKDTE